MDSPPVFYSGAAAALQGLQEHNNQSGATCHIDYDDEEEEDYDDDEEEDYDEEELAWWKHPLKEFNLTSISP